jgi:hypothetical protein
VAFSLCYIVVFVVVFGATLFVPLMLALDRGDMTSDAVLRVAEQLLYVHDHFWPAALVSLIAIGLHSVRVSHKIAGPLYRFTHLFRAITAGRLPKPACLRRGDYLGPEMDVINAMTTSLRGKVTDIHTAWMPLQGAIAELHKVAGNAPREELVERLAMLVDKGHRLTETLEAFSVEA